MIAIAFCVTLLTMLVGLNFMHKWKLTNASPMIIWSGRAVFLITICCLAAQVVCFVHHARHHHEMEERMEKFGMPSMGGCKEGECPEHEMKEFRMHHPMMDMRDDDEDDMGKADTTKMKCCIKKDSHDNKDEK